MVNSDKVVCLVDDDEGARDSLGILLGTYGFTVSTYKSAALFLESIKRKSCDCLVLDIHMPGLDGFGLLNILETHETSFPVIMITGAMNETIPERAKRAGVFKVLEKPVDIDVLVEAICRTVQPE